MNEKKDIFLDSRNQANNTINDFFLTDKMLSCICDIDEPTYNETVEGCKEFVGPIMSKGFQTYEEYLKLTLVEQLGFHILFASISEVVSGIPVQSMLMAKIITIMERLK